MAARDLHERVHVSRLSVKVDRHESFGSRSDGAFNLCGIESERTRVNIDQHRSRPRVEDCGHTGNKCKWSGDDLITGADPSGKQCQMQGASAGIQCDAFCCTAKTGEVLLECSYLWTEDKLAGFENFTDRGINLRLDAAILCLQIEIRYLDGSHSLL